MSDKSSKFPTKKHPGTLDKKSSSSEKQDVAEINTGTIQKRKSNFKAIKPNSLKNSSEIEGTSFLFLPLSLFFCMPTYFIFLFSSFLLFYMFTFNSLLIETSNLIKFKNSHLGKSAPCK